MRAETCPAWIHAILVIGHHVHCYFKISKNLESLVKKHRSRTGLWAGFDKYPISLRKAYYGDAAPGGAVLNFFQASRMRMQFVGVRSLGAKVPARNWRLRVAFDRNQLSVFVIYKLTAAHTAVGTDRTSEFAPQSWNASCAFAQSSTPRRYRQHPFGSVLLAASEIGGSLAQIRPSNFWVRNL